ncbi:MAG: SDR family NAD(P)-dependent oxidoreductase [Dehalococcoidia bacterium]|nr:SDR family NAD(P)-dependent oxidoreductase [Dehalococcoidia bacterium]
MQLEKKRIIVTGSARGMAASALNAFVSEGASVAGLDVKDDLGTKVAEEAARKGPGNSRYFHCDISKKAEVDKIFDAAVRHLGGLDALVHAAGIKRSNPAENITEEEWDLVMDVNIKGTMFTNQAAFRHMREHGGRIVNFGSSAGMRGLPGAAHYSASKGAVLAWTRTVAQEWGKYNITVNAVAPAIWTPMYQETRGKMTPEQLKAHDAAKAISIPIGGRLGDPDRDMAPVLVFLVSDGARFIDGQTIAIDGGSTMVR